MFTNHNRLPQPQPQHLQISNLIYPFPTTPSLTPMFLHTQTKTGHPAAMTTPAATSNHIPSTTPQSHKRTHAAISSPNATASQPPSKRISIKDQRRELARSIIAAFPRDVVEKLLLEAALGNAGIMQEVITANSLKRGDVPSSEGVMENEKENTPERPSQSPQLRSHQDVAVDDQPVPESGDALVRSNVDKEPTLPGGSPSTTADLETISSFDAGGPLQFHHVTHKQFVARKAQIMDILRRNSPQESPSPDQNKASSTSPANDDRPKNSGTSMRWG